jgi:hypothetical protein
LWLEEKIPMKYIELLRVASDTVTIIPGTKTQKQCAGVRTHGIQVMYFSEGHWPQRNVYMRWPLRSTQHLDGGASSAGKEIRMPGQEPAPEPTLEINLSQQLISSLTSFSLQCP